ncbi:MAG: hypothetical protein GZ086_14610 [Gelidibacter sp.]|nr:hypothetical protein [Gelidibacter sp.]
MGETIDIEEMDKYMLFSEYRTDSITYFMLDTNNEISNLIGFNGQQIVFKKAIGSDYIAVQRENIEKLNKYYLSLSNTDSTSFSLSKSEYLNNETVVKVNQKMITPEMRKSIKQSLRQEKLLNDAAKNEKVMQEEQRRNKNNKN